MATTVTLKPNAIDISGSTSGTTTLQATAVAGTTTITLPAATDTLVGKATTDTLTNKTLTSPTITGGALNGTLGATTPSTVAATSITASTTLGVTGLATLTVDASISGLTVGKGGSAVSTNTALGYQALTANTSGDRNVAVGYQSAVANTTGINTSVGYQSLATNTTGTENTAVGFLSLNKNTTGNYNSGLSDQALYNNTTGSNNVAVGMQALSANTTASYNTAVGYQAGNAVTTGQYNCLLGYITGTGLTTGGGNTFVGGGGCATLVTTGSNNTVIGNYSGNSGGLDIRTSSNYIVLSDGAGNPRLIGNANGDFAIGRNPIANLALTLTRGNTGDETLYASNSASSGVTTSITTFSFTGYSPNNTSARFLYCGDTTAERCTIRSNGGIANYSANNVNLSDQREKKDIELAPSYLSKICQIPVKTFLFNDQTDTDLNLGVIAQDVQSVAPELVMESNWGTEEEPKMRLSIYQTDLQYALMKALQELKAEFDAYKATHP